MSKDENGENNPLNLIALVRKPLKWRLHCTRVLIKNSERIHKMQYEIAALIGLAVLILGVVVHSALT